MSDRIDVSGATDQPARALPEPSLDVVTVSGPGAEGFLQGIVSQDVESLLDDVALRSFLLGPQGKLRALLWMTKIDDRFEIFTDSGYGSQVAEDLRYYKIRVKADISDPAPAWYVWGEGVGRAAHLGGHSRYIIDRPPTDTGSLTDDEAASLRIEGGEPVMGVDVDEATIPQETGLVGAAVSFSKGCYLGQELVARLDSRGGRVNRHLRGLLLSARAEPGTVVTFGDEPVGALTSVGWSPRLGRHVGMGLLKRTVSPSDLVSVGDSTAQVTELPIVVAPER